MSETSPGQAESPPAWVLLRTAPDQMTAEIWRGLLESDGIPSTLAPADAVSYLGLSLVGCRVLVPSDVLGEAELILDGQFWVAESTGYAED